jgi:hypothetical protein
VVAARTSRAWERYAWLGGILLDTGHVGLVRSAHGARSTEFRKRGVVRWLAEGQQVEHRDRALDAPLEQAAGAHI